MAQLKVKQISDFVAAVGSIHNATVGTAAGTAISTAKSEAISTAVSADVVLSTAVVGQISTAKSQAISTAVSADTVLSTAVVGQISTAKSEALSSAYSADVVAKSQAISTAFSNDVVVEGRLSTAINDQKLRIDALLLDADETLDTFAEISNFITSLDTADISGLSAAISTGDSTALSSANSYADSLASNYDAAGDAAAAEFNANAYTDQTIINLNFGDIITSNVEDFDRAGDASTAQSIAISTAVSADVVVLSSAKSYADQAELDAISSAVSQAEAKDVVRASAASTALSTAISTEVVNRNAAILALDNDLQAQIDNLSGVASDEVLATFLTATTFRTSVAFNLASHVVVFVNGLQIHESVEDGEGWFSANGTDFSVRSLGYDLEANDHIVVSGTLAS